MTLNNVLKSIKYDVLNSKVLINLHQNFSVYNATLKGSICFGEIFFTFQIIEVMIITFESELDNYEKNR